MVSKASGSRKSKKNTLPKFDVYSKIPQGELIVFAVQYLIEQKIEITLDDIVSVCFLLFPRKFSLKKYPKWPDSALVGRRWGISRKKKYVTASADLEYRLTVKGSRLIKMVSKKLGMVTPKPARKIRKVKVLAPKIPVVVQKENTTPPHAPIKKIRSKISSAIAPVKQAQVVPLSTHTKKKPVRKEKATQLDLIKAETVHLKKESPAAVKQVETQVKKKHIVPAPEPVKKAKPSAPNPVTKEAKERAGKFTRLMERSDAYIHYKKNGSNSKIKEFDFRSLLLCTMESSAETLARNVNLFKGYAAIHHRQDLIVFLIFCEDKFSYLLKPQNKPVRKTKK